MSLHFVVLSFDRYSRDDVIGEVIYPMTSPELEGASMEHPIAITREIAPRSLKVSYINIHILFALQTSFKNLNISRALFVHKTLVSRFIHL